MWLGRRSRHDPSTKGRSTEICADGGPGKFHALSLHPSQIFQNRIDATAAYVRMFPEMPCATMHGVMRNGPSTLRLTHSTRKATDQAYP